METFIHEFEGYFKCKSKCRVYVTKISDITHICFEELDDNPGTSVTNMSEHLANDMIRKLNIRPGLIKFFESYPENNHRKDRSFEEVLYTWRGNEAHDPHWLPSKDREVFEF